MENLSIIGYFRGILVLSGALFSKQKITYLHKYIRYEPNFMGLEFCETMELMQQPFFLVFSWRFMKCLLVFPQSKYDQKSLQNSTRSLRSEEGQMAPFE